MGLQTACGHPVPAELRQVWGYTAEVFRKCTRPCLEKGKYETKVEPTNRPTVTH